MASRYPDDRRLGQVLFLSADSYRKSAALLKAVPTVAAPAPATQPSIQQQVPADRRGVANAPAAARQPFVNRPPSGANTGQAVQAAAQEMTRTQPPPPPSREAREAEERENARRDRLTRAKKLYDRVIDRYRATPPAENLDRLYLKLSHFYRADCLYDLRDYAGAIALYEFAATRYQDDASSLAAHVQIVNAYCALQRFDEARAANERAKWLLRKMPAEAFEPGKSGMSKESWEQWLKWTTTAGVFRE
jgi:tetratricopeptide (TPR) repeat protein